MGSKSRRKSNAAAGDAPVPVRKENGSSSSGHSSESVSKSWLYMMAALVAAIVAIFLAPALIVPGGHHSLVRFLIDGGAASDNASVSATEQSVGSSELPREAPARASVGACTAHQYLSETPVVGFHPICVTRVADDELSVVAFTDGTDSTMTFTVPADYDEVTQALETYLELEELGADPTPPTKFPWRMFTPDGKFQISRLEEVAAGVVGGTKLSFVFKGGSFVWPGVRVGHTQVVDDLHGGDWSIAMTTLSMRPLVFGMSDFLSAEECFHIIDRSAPHMSPSPVSLMDHDLGKENTEWRTSTTYFMATDDDEALQAIDLRVSSLTRTPVDQQEAAQVLRYEKGQRYDAHHDFFNPIFYQKDEGILAMIDHGRRNRMATVFWYLSDVEEGGETNFPLAGGYGGPVSFTACDRGLKVKPQRGKVIMFYSLLPDGQLDDASLHGACPVVAGVKLAANKWVWNRPGF